MSLFPTKSENKAVAAPLLTAEAPEMPTPPSADKSLDEVLNTLPESIGEYSDIQWQAIETMIVSHKLVELEQKISFFDVLSFNFHLDRSGEAEPKLSDLAYDILLKFVREERDSSIEKELEKANRTNVYRLHTPMPGITQIYNQETLIAWINEGYELDINKVAGESEILISDKLDGVSVELVYKSGQLSKAFSKYNGYEGKDILRHCIVNPNIPNFIDSDGHFGSLCADKGIALSEEFVVRGEVEMLDDVFKAKYEDLFKNPRNMIAGMHNRIEPSPYLEDARFICYEICSEQHQGASRSGDMEMLDIFGFETPHRMIMKTCPLGYQIQDNAPFTPGLIWETLTDAFTIIKEHLRDPEVYLNSEGSNSLLEGMKLYALDGFVLEYNSNQVSKRAGLESDGLYRNSRRKFKLNFEEDSVMSEVEYIEWRLHKDGEFRGRAVIKPVQCGGVTVTHASIFNASYVKEGRLQSETWKPVHPIGRGAIVKLLRSGDVIPDIQEVITPASEPDLPREEDWGPIEWDENGVHMVTADPDHPEVKFRKAVRFFAALGTDGFGIPTIRKLFENGYDSIEKILEAFTLKGNGGALLGDLDGIEGFGRATIDKLIENLSNAVTDVWYPNLLAAVDCFGKAVGINRLEGLYHAYGDDCMAWEGYSEADIIFNIEALDDFGPLTAQSFAKGVPQYFEIMESISKYITIAPYPEQEEKISLSNSLEGKKVVFTGIRDSELETLIGQHGGEMGTWNSSNVIVAKDTSIIRPKMQKLLDKGAVLRNYFEFKSELQGTN